MRIRLLVLGLAACCGAVAGEAPRRLTVMSYNIHHARGMDERVDLERIAKVIQSVSPDIVALQEVDRHTRRTGGVDQAAELGRLTGMEVVFGRAIDFQGGQYGNAVLSKPPVLAKCNHPLPFSPGREARAVLAVDVDGFRFLATHLDNASEEDRVAAARVIPSMTEPALPTVLAGDLNAVRGSRPMQLLSEHFLIAGGDVESPTIPVNNPRRQIDYVLFRPAERWRVIEVRVLNEPVASDHLPIVAVLELLPPAGQPEQQAKPVN